MQRAWGRLRAGGSGATACLALAGCAGELARPHQPVSVLPPPVADAVRPHEAGAPDAVPDGPPPDVGDAEVDSAPPAADAGPAPAARPQVYLRVRGETWGEGLRAALSPAQPAAGTTESALESLGRAVTPVFDFGRPSDAQSAQLRAVLARGRPATALYAPDLHPDDIETDVRSLGAYLLDDPACARFGDAPLLFVAAVQPTQVQASALADALERLAALPRPPVVMLGFDPLAPEALPAALSDAARRAVVGRWSTRAFGWAAAGTGEPPGPAEAEALRTGWAWAQARGALWPTARPATNPRLSHAGAPFEAPAGESGLWRSLVLARQWGAFVGGSTPAVFVEALGAWGDDRQLDPLAAAAQAADAPAALTDGHTYPPYGTTRLDALRVVFLAEPEDGPPPTVAAPPLAVVAQTDGVMLERLEQTPRGVAVALRDPSGHGGLEVLLDARPFRVASGARISYTRTVPQLRIEWRVSGEDPAAPPNVLAGLVPDAPTIGRVEVDASPLAGQVVDSVVLVYTGGAETLRGEVGLPVSSPRP